jgi:hypothetical protein
MLGKLCQVLEDVLLTELVGKGHVADGSFPPLLCPATEVASSKQTVVHSTSTIVSRLPEGVRKQW